ncbi:MAG: PHP domain-containing protein, partial [Pseudobdellovibrio sp.]
MNYTELICKTNFSFLRGASSAQEYIEKAIELGMNALAVTDINGVYAIARAYEAILKLKPDFKLIVGSQITVQDHPPVTLIAKNRKGYGLLCRIITAVHADKEKGTGFVTWAELMELLENYNQEKNLFCIPELNKKTNLELLKALFPEHLFLPLCRYLDGLDEQRKIFMLQKSFEHALPFVATNDVHYHNLTRRPLQDALVCIREGQAIDNAGFLLFGNDERYLKSASQMQELFHDLPEALLNTGFIESRCTFHLSELKYGYPAEFIPAGHTPGSYLRELVYKGALETYRGRIPPKVDKQIKRELSFFAKRGDEHYFLTIHDIVRFANEKGIICQGRGSAANSIVCYVLGITSVDPIHMNLLFDRFMNDGRKEPPDVDIDFEHERREEVIQYIFGRFGRERAAMVAAVNTYRSKNAFIELSKALGIETGTISAGELKERFDEIAKEKKDRRKLVDALSEQLKGFPRHLSTHTGGFVLSDDPLIEICPIEPARREKRTIIQWDKDDIETLGLMKIDVLSIGFLTALHKACDLAGINWRDIPPDDLETYRMIQRSETHGTFQIESRAQMAMLAQTQPRNYYDLVVQVALVRPSPTVGGMVQPFIKGLYNARNGRPFKIGNAKLENILGRTYGVPIFQEQIMQISIDVGGFTPSEADQLRRSLGNQRTADDVNVAGQKLYAALINNGIPKKFADDLFNYIKGYAHYGFPESHA